MYYFNITFFRLQISKKKQLVKINNRISLYTKKHNKKYKKPYIEYIMPFKINRMKNIIKDRKGRKK